MPFFLSPRFALMLMLMVPLIGGAAVQPQAVTAFVLGAWAGALTIGPPLAILLWALRIRTLGETIAPLASLPVLVVLTGLILYYGGFDLGPLPILGGTALAAWWVKRRLGSGLGSGLGMGLL